MDKKMMVPLTSKQIEVQCAGVSWDGSIVVNGEISNIELLSGNDSFALLVTTKPGDTASTYSVDIRKVSEQPEIDGPLPTRNMETKDENDG